PLYEKRAAAYQALNQPEAALRDYTQLIRLNPDDPRAYTARAEIYRQRKQYAEAARDYTRLLALGANKAPLYQKRAEAYRQLKQADKAIADYGELVKLNPRNLQARADRADLLLGQGKYAEVHEDYTRILEAAPKAAVIWRFWRARAILNWQNLKDFDAALA